MPDQQQPELSDPHMVPELVLDPPDGLRAVWYPHVRAIVVSDGTNEFTLRPAELRALNDWSRLHELHG